MRHVSWKPWKLRVPCLLAFAVLIAMTVLGCSQSLDEGGGDQNSEGQPVATQGVYNSTNYYTGEDDYRPRDYHW